MSTIIFRHSWHGGETMDGERSINLPELIAVGTRERRSVVVSPELTVGHFVPGMPQVYATPMMIMLMELAAGAAIGPLLPPGYVSVGMEVNVRHLGATAVGRLVHATAKVVEVTDKTVLFEVEAFDGDRLIGEGTHRRGLVNADAFKKRFNAS